MSVVAPTELRRVSASLFGNEKVVEVVLAFGGADAASTATQIASETALQHALVRAVLVRLAAGGAIRPLPRASARGTLYYEVADAEIWDGLVRLCRTVAQIHDGDR